MYYIHNAAISSSYPRYFLPNKFVIDIGKNKGDESKTCIFTVFKNDVLAFYYIQCLLIMFNFSTKDFWRYLINLALFLDITPTVNG